MALRSAISNDLFAAQHPRETTDKLGDPLQRLEKWIDFLALALQVDQAVPRPYPPEEDAQPIQQMRWYVS